MSTSASTSDAPGTTAAPAGWPVHDLTFVEAVKRGFRQYVHFDGRASRREFWYFYLFVVGVMLVLLAPTIAIGTATATTQGEPGPFFVVGFVLLGLFYAGVLLPVLAVACRRLHDAGFSGLFLLLGLVTGLIPLVMCALPTSPNAVRFGPPGPAGPGLPSGVPGAALPYGAPDAYAQQPPAPYGRQVPPGYGQQPPSAYGQQPTGPYGQQPPSAYGRQAPPAYGQQPQPWGPQPGAGDQDRRD